MSWFLLQQLLKQNRILQENTGGAGSAGGSGEKAPEEPKKDEEPPQAPKEEEKPIEKTPEGDRKFTDDEAAKLLKENMQKKETIKKLQEELDGIKESIKDLDLEQVREVLKSEKDRKTKELEAKGEWDKLKKQMSDEHAKEKAELQKSLDDERSSKNALIKQIEELTIGSNFAQSKFVVDEITLPPSKTRLIYGDYFSFEDGAVVAYDKPLGSENRTKLVDASGEPLGFDEAMKRIIESDPEKDQLLRSKVKQGANSKTITNTKSGKQETELSSLDKISMGLKNL